MSYDIDLCDPVTKEVIHIDSPHFMRGGTYAMNGTTELSFNITYNYSKIFYRDDIFGDKGIYIIDGKSGLESTEILQNAINKLNNDVDKDYWKCTEGNVKQSLISLLTFAKMRPDGIWCIF
jgi:hypothetical protein